MNARTNFWLRWMTVYVAVAFTLEYFTDLSVSVIVFAFIAARWADIRYRTQPNPKPRKGWLDRPKKRV